MRARPASPSCCRASARDRAGGRALARASLWRGGTIAPCGPITQRQSPTSVAPGARRSPSPRPGRWGSPRPRRTTARRGRSPRPPPGCRSARRAATPERRARTRAPARSAPMGLIQSAAHDHQVDRMPARRSNAQHAQLPGSFMGDRVRPPITASSGAMFSSRGGGPWPRVAAWNRAPSKPFGMTTARLGSNPRRACWAALTARVVDDCLGQVRQPGG